MKKENKTKYVLLGFLDKAEMSGYDIKKQMEKSTNHFWSESFGQIYPNLKRLAEDGLIEMIEDEKSKQNRKTYKITEQGKKVLKEWLEKKTYDDKMRSEFLLKLFFADNMSKESLKNLIEESKEKNRENIKNIEGTVGYLNEILKSCDSVKYPLATALYGKYFYEALEKWYTDMEELLDIK